MGRRFFGVPPDVFQYTQLVPDFIHARGTFYAVKEEDHSYYFCFTDEAGYSLLKATYPKQLEVDGVTIAYQAAAAFVTDQFRAWINSGG